MKLRLMLSAWELRTRVLDAANSRMVRSLVIGADDR